MNQSIRWGIIGCGDVTEVKSGPALQKAKGSELVAVMRRDAAKAQDYARRHRVARWYSSADDLINDPEINAVYIATPPASHKEYTLKVAAAGKTVLVEKPMALSLADCQTMIAACQQHSVALAVAYYRRCLPRFEKMRTLVQQGAIGEPRMIVVRHFIEQGTVPKQAWKIDPKIGGGGYFADMQTHTLDWLDHVFGPIQDGQSYALNQAQLYDAEDAVSLCLRCDNNILVNGIFAYASARNEESVTVYGNAGDISMSFFKPSVISLNRNGQQESFDLSDPPHVHQPFIQVVVDYLLSKRTNLPCDGAAALRTTALLERLLKQT